MNRECTERPNASVLHSQPWLRQAGVTIPEFDAVRQFRLGLSHSARLHSCERLDQILADAQILHAFDKKSHGPMRGHTFYRVQLLLDKHADEQLALNDAVAERIQTLGGVAVGDPRHAAEISQIPGLQMDVSASRCPRSCGGTGGSGR